MPLNQVSRIKPLILEANDIGQFYKFVNNKLRNNSRIGVLVDNDGTDVVGDRDKANLLNDYFVSVCSVRDTTDPNDNLLRNLPNRNPSCNMNTVHFDVNNILTAVRKIKSKSKTSTELYANAYLNSNKF